MKKHCLRLAHLFILRFFTQSSISCLRNAVPHRHKQFDLGKSSIRLPSQITRLCEFDTKAKQDIKVTSVVPCCKRPGFTGLRAGVLATVLFLVAFPDSGHIRATRGCFLPLT